MVKRINGVSLGGRMSVRLSAGNLRVAWSGAARLVLLAAILWLAAPARALDPTRRISQFHHTAWDIRSGMPANIRAIVQTPDGYLWLGSVNGLYRFDGLHVERIAATALPSPSVDALAVTPSGGLWIGYERPVGVVSYLRGGRVVNYPLDVPTSTAVHSFVTGPGGAVWAATPDHILRFNGRRWVMLESDWGTSFGEAAGGVWAFAIDRDGVVWSKNLKGLYYLAPGMRRFARAPGYPGGAAGFARTSDGRILTTDEAATLIYELPGVAQLRGGPPPLARLASKSTGGAAASAAAPDSLRGPILVDHDGTLWCASFSGGGLFRKLPQAQQARGGVAVVDRFAAKDGLSSDLVHALFEDREGNIWIGTGLGLDRFRNANVVTQREVPVGFRARFVQSNGDTLYAYTGWSATPGRVSDGTQSLFKIRAGRPPELLVRDIGRLRGPDLDPRTGRLWFSTQRGMQELQGSRLEPPIVLPQGVAGNRLLSGVHDQEGAIWISAYGKGVFRQQPGGRWQRVPVRSPRGATGVLIPDGDASMWIRFSGGSLFRIIGDQVEDHSSSGLGIGDITFIKPFGRGLIIGGEFGLGRIVAGHIQVIRAEALPLLSGVTGIAQGRDGSSWIFTQEGILRVAAGSLGAAFDRSDARLLRFELFDSADGLPGTPHGGAYGSTTAVDVGGRVWFTTGNGLVWIDPGNLHHNPFAPNVVIRSVIAGDRRFDFPASLHLPAGTSKLQIAYAGLSLTIPERNHYRYKLDGVDRTWVDPGSRGEAFYTNLGPGTYRFHVIASNNDGVWNRTGASLQVTIPPTFLQSWFFTLLLILLGALLLWAAYRWRMRLLTERLQSRLEARLAERERIARELHDTLLQGFQGLLLRFHSVAGQIPDQLAVRGALDQVLDRAEMVLVEGRERVQEIRSAPGNLPTQLQAIADELAVPGTDFRLIVEGAPRLLHPLVFEEAARIAAEAIRNAFKHGGAREIEANILYHRRCFRLSVADNGQGLDPEVALVGERSGHYGLLGMRERARRIGGTVEIASRPGAGCEVTLLIPARMAYAKGQPGRAQRAARRAPERVEA